VAETTVKDYYAVGFDTVVKKWDKCISVGGGYTWSDTKKMRLTLYLRN
jgi:hypothetical protein